MKSEILKNTVKEMTEDSLKHNLVQCRKVEPGFDFIEKILSDESDQYHYECLKRAQFLQRYNTIRLSAKSLIES